MGYKQELIGKILDSDKWPSFGRPDFLNTLNKLADDASKKDSLEGYLAALLIYHQLCEEMARLLLKDTQFFIQLSVFPAAITFVDRPKSMFGSLLDDLDATVSFQGKELFTAKCRELNKIRIDFVHGLTKRASLAEIRNNLAHTRKMYDEIFDIFEQAHDHFYECFKDFKKNLEWDEILVEADE